MYYTETKVQAVKRTYRPTSPDQHAQFLHYISTIDINISQTTDSTQLEFDNFYIVALELLNTFYPERTTTVTSRDPAFITPRIKSLLRRKNKLMRAGWVEQASALAKRIGKCITNRNKRRFCREAGQKIEAKDMWAAVQQLTRPRHHSRVIEGVCATAVNSHYAAISTDLDYTAPR